MERKIWLCLTMIVILLIPTSFAWWYWNSPNNTNIDLEVDGLTVEFEDGQNITGVNLIPVSSKEKGISDNTAIKKIITVSSNQTVYMDLDLELETLPDGLKDKSFLWKLYNGNILVSNGNFASVNQGDVIKLAKNETITSTVTTYNLYIWIDGTQENPSSMMNQSFKFVLSANGTNETPLLPNKPNTSNGLIPVTYTDNTWVKADSDNINNTWYNYDNKKYANAVAVTSTYRNSDGTDRFNVGDEIPEDAILAYYVWIPRYKYKVWNINKVIGTDSYNAKTIGIDVVWESGQDITGEIKCTYDFTVTNGSLSENCSGSNGEYYTHPAFWWDINGNDVREVNEELTGIWVGKFEISSSDTSQSYGGGNTYDLQVRIKPNVVSWRYNLITNFSKVIQNMSVKDNEYGLTTTAESHMLKNMEWGAVIYLSHSEYGRCNNNVCEEISLNSSSYYITGCGYKSEDSTSSGNICNEYNTEIGRLSSTTANVYGIYDMSGGAYEYMMANMSSEAGSYIYSASSGGSNFSYSETTARYVDRYAYGSTYNNQTAYNRARLGDATAEVVTRNGNVWRDDYGYFVNSSSSWFDRGGYYTNDGYAGMFLFSSDVGTYYPGSSARASLIGEL